MSVSTEQQVQQTPSDEIQERIESLQTNLKDYMVKQKDVMKDMVSTLTQVQKLITKTLKQKSKGRRRNTTVHRYKLDAKSAKSLSKIGLSGDTFSRSEVMKAVSAYIKQHNLQNPDKKTVWEPDSTLTKVFGVKKGEECSYLQINKFIAPFFKDAEKVEPEAAESSS